VGSLNRRGRQKSVKTGHCAVKKPSTPAVAGVVATYRRRMGVLIFVLLTAATFALLGLVQKLVERL
jgi:hypothetical protein